MLGLMGFSGSLPLYVIHRYYIFVFIDRANKDACLLTFGDMRRGSQNKKWELLISPTSPSGQFFYTGR